MESGGRNFSLQINSYGVIQTDSTQWADFRGAEYLEQVGILGLRQKKSYIKVKAINLT